MEGVCLLVRISDQSLQQVCAQPRCCWRIMLDLWMFWTVTILFLAIYQRDKLLISSSQLQTAVVVMEQW